MELLDLRLRDFLDEIAGEGRTPGGGSVAALVTAMAAGLLAKVARGSTGTWPEAAGIAAQAESLRARAAPLAQADAEQYEAALLARGQSGEGQGARQDFALGQAYAKAAEPPLQIAQAASDVAQLALTVAQNGEAALWADAVTAALLAAAAAKAAAELVAVNLTASAGDRRVLEAAKVAEEAARAAEAARAVRE
ncbi:MAG TPA: cyclodeaminase/cyclohydrolase family protein [Gaiellaceae bacterium]